MQLPTILAHGALGVFDELIYLGIALLFVIIMAISWLRSRSAVVEKGTAGETHEAQEKADHFKLD
jgi:hypothetical protein